MGIRSTRHSSHAPAIRKMTLAIHTPTGGETRPCRASATPVSEAK